MSVVELVLLVLLGAGLAVVLGELRWFRRRPLAHRLRPYSPAGPATPAPTPSSPAAVLLPLVDQALDRAASALGIGDDLGTRLARADVGTDPAAFRIRQVVHGLIGLAAGAALALALRPGGVLAAVLVVGLPVLCVLADEQRLSNRIAQRSHVLQLELPVVAEQLGILIDAGSSLPAALARIADRGRGAAAADLRRVVLRIRRGASEAEALAEWADRTDVGAVRRLVAVLSLHREAGDLGRLISAEARAIRAETHRELVERIERRSQLVWIPVTVATLVPGLLFLAVPFVSALAQVTGA
ncbi:type II secretion system F family protein [Dermatobacter hominis]|uniref:type II secretion system F family protein n=1 Tax=Dermatobacter hominis TaxID=2884263 RepID=UPI001D124DF8|nr:type II secretion system F family protein [Dermatobacter hominis]UDY35794.1 type II secretion system F family protein [Dermatobacter hominis]